MANVKRITLDHPTSGMAVYMTVVREADGYYLDSTGAFVSGFPSAFTPLEEHASIRGRYNYDDSRAVWNDGRYSVYLYSAVSSSQTPAKDTRVGYGELFISNDTEVVPPIVGADSKVILSADPHTGASIPSVESLASGAINATTFDPGGLASIHAAFLVLNDSLSGPTVTSTTVQLSGSGAANDDAYNGMTLCHFNAAGELIQVRTIVDYDHATLTLTVDRPWSVNPADTDRIRVFEPGTGIPRIGLLKGAAFPNFLFPMVNTSGDPLTGLTVTAQRVLDGGAIASCSNTPAEVSAGWYRIDLSAADLTSECTGLLFTATGARPAFVSLVTQR